MTAALTPLHEIARIAGKPVNPQKCPEEEFALFSIPAFDAGAPEITKGGNVKSGKTQVQPGQVMVSKLNPRIPRVWLVEPQKTERCIASTEFIPIEIERRAKVLPEFLMWMCRSPQFMGPLQSGVKSSTKSHQRVRPALIMEQSIPVPPLAEQRRIVGRVKECMERIGEVRELRVEGLKEASALFFSTAYETYQRLCREQKTTALSELVVAMGGGTPSKKNEAFWNGSIPWVSPKDMKTWELFDAKDHITEAAIAGSSTKMVPAETVLMVVRGMILAHSLPIALARVPLTINQDMKALIAGKRVVPEYIAYMLVGAKPILLNKVLVAGHGTRRLLTETWSNLPIPVPGLEHQRAIVDELDAVRSTTAEMVATFDSYTTDHEHITGAVLRKAFAGEL